jgi:carbamoyl-phosphate synthase large subunit
MSKKTVLITSAGSQVGEGIIRSIGTRRDRLKIVGINSVVENPVNFQCDTTYLVPELGNKKAFKQKLAEIVSYERPSLVLPGRDDDVIMLSELGRYDHEFNQLLATGGYDLCRTIRSKLDIYHYAQLNDLPFCLTIDMSNEDIENQASDLIENHGWPVIVKPEDGHGSHDIWILSDWVTLRKWFGKSDYVLQPFLSATNTLKRWLNSFQEGIPLHSSAPDTIQDVVQVILGPDSSLVSMFGMHSQMKSGRSWRVTPNNDEELLALGRRFAEVLGRDGWRGPLNIQTRYHDGQYIPFEINGRFNGTTSARTELGFDEIRLSLLAFLDIDLGDRKNNGSADFLHRRSNDYALHQNQLSELELNGVWRATD